MATIVVMTYNVWWPHNQAQVTRVVNAVSPDLVIVQEAPKAIGVWRWQCDRVARAWQLRRVSGGRDAGSNMICVSGRVTVLDASKRRLTQPRFKPRRGIVTAQCEVGGYEFGVVGVHLSLLKDSRPAEAAEALADAARLRGPTIVAGDLNELPSGPAWQVFRDAGYVDHARPDDTTFSSTTREKRIDALLVKGLTVADQGVPSLAPELLSKASDHCPVVATIEL
ncbi:MAG: endonuclease/exonuclease/phosphatase family protein [Nocardioidaceae bacterium]